MKNSQKLFLFILSSGIFIWIDWATKLWAKKHLFYVRSQAYFDGLFMLDYAENKGAALSMGSKLPESQAFWVLQILPSLVLFFLLIYVFKNFRNYSTIALIGFAGIFGGGFANLVDRFQNKRQVVDFMIINLGEFQTGIFNFADVFISIGVVTLFLSSFFQSSKS
ncbi:MAG: signal peptidase II [Bacteroidota bacterium]